MTDAKDVREARRIIETWREESPHLVQPEHWIPPIIALLDSFDTLTRERDEAVDRGLELQAQLMTMLVQRDEARVVTDAMVGRASVALWDRYGDHGVEDGDIRVMLTAALPQGDA
jgi:hypothetical protein